MDANLKSTIVKGSIANAVINAVINGAINWFTIKDKSELLLSDNLISSQEHTVFSGAVPLAVSLAFILTSIAYLTFPKEGRPAYFPKVFLMGLKYSFFAFGLVVVAAIIIQRITGVVYVSTLGAATITGIIAGLVGGVVNYATLVELNKK